MPSTSSPKPRPWRTPSLNSLTDLCNNPPPITLWPTIFPPSGSLTPLLTSTNPKQKIQALAAVITLITSSKKFIIAAWNALPSATAFTTPAAIAMSTTEALCNILPGLLDERHPIALAKTARLAAELSACGMATPSIAEKLHQLVLDESIDRTSRAAAASALVSAVDKGDTDRICTTFSKSLSSPLAPVAEMLAVLRVAVVQLPMRFVSVWQNAGDVLVRVLSDSAVGLHAVRLVQGFVSALLESGSHCTQNVESDKFVKEGVYELLPTVYDCIFAPAATCDNQPMQLSAIAAIDAFQQLPIATASHKLADMHHILRRLSEDAAIPVRSAALKALGNHPMQFEEIFTFIVTTPAKPMLPRAKAFSAAAVLLEKMTITAEVLTAVESFVQAAMSHIQGNSAELSKAEKTADESLRVACLAFLGVALVRLVECGNGVVDVENAVETVMRSAMESSVNVRVHSCKSLARVLKDGYNQKKIVEFLCSLLVPHAPVRVMMASTRALLGLEDLSTLQNEQKLLFVQASLVCSKEKEGIGDTRARALRQALRRLLGELVVRVIEEGVDWRNGEVEMADLYDCVAIYYQLPGFLKDQFLQGQGSDNVLVEFPEETRTVLRRLLELPRV